MRAVMRKKASTDALLRRAQEGDRSAFDELAREWTPRLEALVRLKLGRELRARVEVDDLVQETLLGAWRSIDTLRSPGGAAFFRWLAGIANHVVANEARCHRRRPVVPETGEAAASDPSPSRAMRRDERFDRLEEALDAMSPDHREVVLLARIEGLSLAEVAARMNRSPGAVAQLLWRALRQLRERFGDTGSFHLPERRIGDRSDRDGT